jgi:hypothetical protein
VRKFFLRVHASLEDLGIPEATGVAVFWVSEICMYMHLKCMSTASVIHSLRHPLLGLQISGI